MLYLRATAAWLLILGLAILNGGLREVFLVPRIGSPAAQLVSGVILIGFIVAVSFLLVPRLGARSPGQRAGIGVLWLALSVAFEFGFGLGVQGKSWPELLAAYTFQHGNIWPIVLLATLVAPPLFGGRSSAGS